ncbi:hypothetical protein Ccrd_013627 [Cynara cardunculus var. scolymus]|uniref:Uncharacterized protein n=1 Tax=Cynara cardunculus var. scolymus TaxID=59895 RepID=A0A103YF82_CYNCS|nr:hypothetical protein Ccrd_013627 [Cynara cardunculus var. scolymus]
MDELEFQRVLHLFPVVRTRDYNAESEIQRQLTTQASRRLRERINSQIEGGSRGSVTGGIDGQDAFWEKLKAAAANKFNTTISCHGVVTILNTDGKGVTAAALGLLLIANTEKTSYSTIAEHACHDNNCMNLLIRSHANALCANALDLMHHHGSRHHIGKMWSLKVSMKDGVCSFVTSICSMVGNADAEEFVKAFQHVYRKLVFEELSLTAAQRFVNSS